MTEQGEQAVPETSSGPEPAASGKESAQTLDQVVREWLHPLLDLIAESDVEELAVEHQGVRVALKRTTQTEGGGETAVSADSSAAAAAGEPSLHTVHAGWVGVFSRSRGEGQRAVLDEGAPVAEGQLLGYVEVLNVLNEIQAPIAGTLERFLVESRQPVEYGQPLALIQPAAEPPLDDVE